MNSIELTEVESKHIESIRWLFSDEHEDRASGRTTVLSIVMIERALRELWCWFDVVDNHPMDYRNIARLKRKLSVVFLSLKLEKYEIQFSESRIFKMRIIPNG